MTNEHMPQIPGYLVIPNTMVQDYTISYRAKGVLFEILSRPSDWKITKQYFIRKGSGNIIVNSIFKELQEAGYLGLQTYRKGGFIYSKEWLVSFYPDYLDTLPQINLDNEE